MPKNQKVDLYYDRMFLALVLGALVGFFIAYKFFSNYVFWITICSAIAFGIETITRVSSETKKANPPQKTILPPAGIADPNPRQKKKLPKKFFK